MGGPHPGPEKIEALRSRPGLEQFLKSLQVILTHGRGRETQEDARFGGEAVTSVRPRRPRRRLQRPPGQRRHGDRGPGSAVGPPGLQSSWPLTTRAACGRGSEAFRCGPGARAAPASQGVKEAAAGPEEGGCPLPHPRGVPCSAATPFPAPRPLGVLGHEDTRRAPASRLRGPTTCYQRPARSVEETVVMRGHQSVTEGHRETAPGPAARSGAPRGAAPRIRGP